MPINMSKPCLRLLFKIRGVTTYTATINCSFLHWAGSQTAKANSRRPLLYRQPEWKQGFFLSVIIVVTNIDESRDTNRCKLFHGISSNLPSFRSWAWTNILLLRLIWEIEHRQSSVAAGGWTKCYNAVCLSLKLPIWEIEHLQSSVAAGGWTKWYNVVCLSLNLQVWGIEHLQLSVAAGGWTKWYNVVCLSLNLQIWGIEHLQLSVAAGGWTKWYNIVCLSLQVWEIEHRQSSVAAGGWTKWYNVVCLSLNLQIWEIEHQQLSVAAGGWTKWYNAVCWSHYRFWSVCVLFGLVQWCAPFLIAQEIEHLQLSVAAGWVDKVI
jgi:hypothetical protein